MQVRNAYKFKLTALVTSAEYQGKSARGIALNLPWQAVSEAYGPPDLRQPFGGGRWAHYEKPALIICTDGQDKVNRWVVYALERVNGSQ